MINRINWSRFLVNLDDGGIMPLHIRSDMGTETGMLANAYYQLSLANWEEEIELKNVFWYGPSLNGV